MYYFVNMIKEYRYTFDSTLKTLHKNPMGLVDYRHLTI